MAFTGTVLRLDAVFERRSRIPLRLVWRAPRRGQGKCIGAGWDRYDPFLPTDRERLLSDVPGKRRPEAERLLIMLTERLIAWRARGSVELGVHRERVRTSTAHQSPQRQAAVLLGGGR